jgi:hypothetical protein
MAGYGQAGCLDADGDSAPKFGLKAGRRPQRSVIGPSRVTRLVLTGSAPTVSTVSARPQISVSKGPIRKLVTDIRTCSEIAHHGTKLQPL